MSTSSASGGAQLRAKSTAMSLQLLGKEHFKGKEGDLRTGGKMSRDKAETVSKRWNIHLRENLKADHYPKNTSCKQQFAVQKEYLSSSILIGYFLQFSSTEG